MSYPRANIWAWSGRREIARRLLRSGDLPAAGGVPTTVVVTTGAGSDRATGPRGEILTLHHLLPCEHLACEAELVARDGGCCFPGCGRPAAWAEAHHIRAWSEGGDTDIDNLGLLCAYHHREFGRQGWQVRLAADGHPEWLPPAHVDPHRPRLTPREMRVRAGVGSGTW